MGKGGRGRGSGGPLKAIMTNSGYCEYFPMSRCQMPCLPSRLGHIVTVSGENQPNLDLYLVQRYKICYFLIVVLYLCIGQNLKNQPN